MDSPTDLVDRLTTHKTIGTAPREELEWLASHGYVRHFNDGDIVSRKGEPVEGLFITLAGHFAIFVDRGSGPTKAHEWRAGEVGGVLPYSRLVNPPGQSIALEPSDILVVPRAHLTEMIRDCHEVTSILVHVMLDRVRHFKSNELHDEKMISLGKLSAGLAHELNNPAAAIERSAGLLTDRLEDAEQATRALGAADLSEAQLAAIDEVRASCLSKAVAGVLSPIQQAEREDAITDWLANHGVETAIAGPLAETAVTLQALDRVAEAVSGSCLEAVLRWTAAGCSVRGIASEIQEAAMRIAGLVMAIKGFTHMDQATVAEPVDVASGLRNTIAVLKAKARAKSIAVGVTVEPGLPRALGFVGELNQVWANLIDNAIDALPKGGQIEISAKCERQRVIVRVVDNGPGIPAEIRGHVFEPFFTTKPVGQGTGLGLDIVKRLIQHNDGQIGFESQPGRTEFCVSLLLAQSEGQGGQQ